MWSSRTAWIKSFSAAFLRQRLKNVNTARFLTKILWNRLWSLSNLFEFSHERPMRRGEPYSKSDLTIALYKRTWINMLWSKAFRRHFTINMLREAARVMLLTWRNQLFFPSKMTPNSYSSLTDETWARRTAAKLSVFRTERALHLSRFSESPFSSLQEKKASCAERKCSFLLILGGIWWSRQVNHPWWQVWNVKRISHEGE